jgi:hypothetical protein
MLNIYRRIPGGDFFLHSSQFRMKLGSWSMLSKRTLKPRYGKMHPGGSFSLSKIAPVIVRVHFWYRHIEIIRKYIVVLDINLCLPWIRNWETYCNRKSDEVRRFLRYGASQSTLDRDRWRISQNWFFFWCSNQELPSAYAQCREIVDWTVDCSVCWRFRKKPTRETREAVVVLLRRYDASRTTQIKRTW